MKASFLALVFGTALLVGGGCSDSAINVLTKDGATGGDIPPGAGGAGGSAGGSDAGVTSPDTTETGGMAGSGGRGGSGGAGGTAATGGIGAGGIAAGGTVGIDARPVDAPMGQDSGNGGLASGGTGPRGGTGAGGMNSGGGATARGGSTGTGGAGAGGVVTGGNSGGTTSTGGRAGGSTGHAACQTDADCTGTNYGYTCCNGLCSNTGNDILNCGACGTTCTGANPYCLSGTCGAPPCQGSSCGADTRCCGTQCCGAGKLCCTVNLGGPSGLGCFDPVDGTCPPGCSTCVCASPDTPIATPTGDRPIASLRVGDLVFSDHEGALVAVPLIKVAHRPAAGHFVVHVITAKGSVLNISGPHPTADGRRFADLKVGDLLDGDAIIVRELQPYPHAFTYDILPASSTGTYVADGLLIGSTLK